MIFVVIILFVFIISIHIKNRSLKLDVIIAEKRIEEIRNNFELYRKLSDCNSKQNDRSIEELKSRNSELIIENIQLKSLVGAYRNTFGNGFQSTYYTPTISKDTVDAVRYAMKHAHPDNGGNAEDFIKFQKCYEELTRK